MLHHQVGLAGAQLCIVRLAVSDSACPMAEGRRAQECLALITKYSNLQLMHLCSQVLSQNWSHIVAKHREAESAVLSQPRREIWNHWGAATIATTYLTQ